MPREATGNVYQDGDRYLVRVTIGPKGERRKIPLAACATPEAAEQRGVIVATLAKRLRAAGVPLEVALRTLTLAGERKDGKPLADVLSAADALCSGDARAKLPEREAVTFQQIGERWTSGELARDFPDHVKAKGTAERDAQRLARYVYPLAGPVRIVDFALEDAERVMRSLPPGRVRTAATRRHVAQLIHRVLALAVFPLRIIKTHPLPPGFRPKLGPPRAKGYVYPDEDAALMRCAAVPLCWRVLYGFLDREGPRVSEAAALDLADVDLRRGVVTLDVNKTDDPRAWALGPDVVRALRAWVAWREAAAGAPLPRSAPMFCDEAGERIGEGSLAAQFREHLEAAGVDRAALFEHNAKRQRIRAHDLRATFVTLALANGRTETWVADRTGHKSSDMINRYRRAARTAGELALGWLAPLDASIPELASEPDTGGDGTPGAGGKGAEDEAREGPALGRSAAEDEAGEAAGGEGSAAANEAAESAGSALEAAPTLATWANVAHAPPAFLATSRDRRGCGHAGASLNPLIMVRIHAPEPRIPARPERRDRGTAARRAAVFTRRGASSSPATPRTTERSLAAEPLLPVLLVEVLRVRLVDAELVPRHVDEERDHLALALAEEREPPAASERARGGEGVEERHAVAAVRVVAAEPAAQRDLALAGAHLDELAPLLRRPRQVREQVGHVGVAAQRARLLDADGVHPLVSLDRREEASGARGEASIGGKKRQGRAGKLRSAGRRLRCREGGSIGGKKLRGRAGKLRSAGRRLHRPEGDSIAGKAAPSAGRRLHRPEGGSIAGKAAASPGRRLHRRDGDSIGRTAAASAGRRLLCQEEASVGGKR
jgi:integrase